MIVVAFWLTGRMDSLLRGNDSGFRGNDRDEQERHNAGAAPVVSKMPAGCRRYARGTFEDCV